MKGATTMKRTRKLSLVDSPETSPVTAHEKKLAAAKVYLGSKWCLHPHFNKAQLANGCLDAWKATMRPGRVTVTSKEKR